MVTGPWADCFAFQKIPFEHWACGEERSSRTRGVQGRLQSSGLRFIYIPRDHLTHARTSELSYSRPPRGTCIGAVNPGLQGRRERGGTWASFGINRNISFSG